MRRTALLSAVILVALSVAVARWLRPSHEWTTRSAEAARLLAAGEADLRSFRWQRAERALSEAVAADPGFAMARAALAEVQAALGQQQQSERSAQAADSLALRLRDTTERLTVQLRLSNLERPFAARRDSLLALLAPRAPGSVIVARTRALAAEQRRDWAAEEAAWRDALAADPNDASAWNQLGYLAARQGRYAEAEAHLARYAYLAPDLANPHDSLGEILLYQGKLDEAERELKAALSLQPDFFPSLLNLALVHLARGRVEKGTALLEKVREPIAGTEWEKRVDGALMQAYWDHDLRPELQAAVARWVAKWPDDWQTPYFRALGLALAGRPAEARAECDAFAASLPKLPWYERSPVARAQADARVRVCRGLLAFEAGDFAASEREFAAALALRAGDPPHETWALQLRHAETLLRTGRPADALAQAREVLASNPRRLRATALETRALLALGRRDEAAAALARLRDALAGADPAIRAAVEAAPFARQLEGVPAARPGA